MSDTISYKNSGVKWIGEVPSHWKMSRLKYLTTNHDGKRIPLNLEQRGSKQGDFPYYGATGIIDSVDEYIFEGEYLLIGEDGAPFFIPYQDVAFIADGKFWVNNHCHILKSKEEINTKYLCYFLNSVDYRNYITGSTRDKLTQSDLNIIEISTPPLIEQKKISTYLDAKTKEINNIIAKKEKLIDSLKEERIEIINHSTTKGINEKVEFKSSGIDWIKEIPKSWTTKRIKHIAKTFGRIGYRGYQTSDLVNEGEGAITLSPSNMKELEMDYTKCTYLSWEKYDESPEIQIENGDVIFVKTGSTFGKVALVNNLPEKATINPQLLVFKNIKISNDFFYFVLLSELIRGQVNTSVIGGTIPTISQEKIGNYYLFVPPMEEQKEIVAAVRKHLDRIKTAIATITQEIELIKEYKAALINEVVTGKIILN